MATITPDPLQTQGSPSVFPAFGEADVDPITGDFLNQLSTGFPMLPELFNDPGVQQFVQDLSTEQRDQLRRDVESLLGFVPGISQPPTLRFLVESGTLTQEEAQKILAEGGDWDSPLYTKMGSTLHNFLQRGGIRALSGPWAAAVGQVASEYQRGLGLANSRAWQQAIEAYARMAQIRAQALSAGAGVAGGIRQQRISVEGARERAEADRRNQPGQTTPSPISLPTPDRPSPWPGVLGTLGASLITAAPALYKLFGAGGKTPSDTIREQTTPLGFGGGPYVDFSGNIQTPGFTNWGGPGTAQYEQFFPSATPDFSGYYNAPTSPDVAFYEPPPSYDFSAYYNAPTSPDVAFYEPPSFDYGFTPDFNPAQYYEAPSYDFAPYAYDFQAPSYDLYGGWT